jgi:predicted amidohydrolase YtcJ
VRAQTLTAIAPLTPLLVALLLGVAIAAAAEAAETRHADLVIVNAHVWTVDDARPEAEALAVLDGRIVLVGGNAEARALAGPKARVIDARGRLVLPGFQDDHAHFLQGGAQLGQLDLKDAATHEEFGRRIAEHAKTKAPGEWITGGNWDHDRFPRGELPTAALIDRYCPDRPVLVSRFDGHMAVANSLALRAGGITAASADPTGGTIVRQPGSQEPAGVLKDAAMEPVLRKVPPRTAAQLVEDARKALGEARRLGLTAIHDITEGEPHLRAYETVRAEGGLTTRIYCRWPIADWQTLAARVARQGFGDDLLSVRSLKAFADGSIGSSTALFFTPYADDPKNLGLPSDHAHRILEWALAADRSGLQLSVHAIGDRAIYDVLDVFERVARANGPRDRRPRIEHDQHTHPADFGRHVALGVFASVQPYHAIDDGRFVEGRIGRRRCLSTYAFRSFLEAGVRVGMGSDWTVAPLDPILGIDAAVNRRTLDGKNPGGWFPEQKLTVAEAIRAYTLDNAWAAFWDDRTGSLTPGKYADVVILDRDLLRVPADEIVKAAVDVTILAGRVVYERTPRP